MFFKRFVAIFQDNLKAAEQKELVVNGDYLFSLGFVVKPAVYPDTYWRNTTLPVIATYVLDDEHSQAIGLVMCAAKYLPDHAILVYNLGISDYQLVLVRRNIVILFVYKTVNPIDVFVDAIIL